MNLDKLREKLQDRRLSVISKATNIHVTTISRVRDKQVIPSYSTFEKLARYFEANP